MSLLLLFQGTPAVGANLTNPYGINSLLSARGLGLSCLLYDVATGVQSTIAATHGITSEIIDTFGVNSSIDETGKGVDGS